MDDDMRAKLTRIGENMLYRTRDILYDFVENDLTPPDLMAVAPKQGVTQEEYDKAYDEYNKELDKRVDAIQQEMLESLLQREGS